jgi:DNA-binding HxlR family transcriptional regulator
VKLQNATTKQEIACAMLSRPDIRCSIAASLDVIGERWSLLIIREAVMGSRRFDEFHERIGVARNILASRLMMLVENGILLRSQSPENARIYLYTLTPKGRDLLPVLTSIMQWGDRWLHAKTGAPIVLTDRKTGSGILPLGLKTSKGIAVTMDDLVITAGPGATEAIRKRLGSSAT